MRSVPFPAFLAPMALSLVACGGGGGGGAGQGGGGAAARPVLSVLDAEVPEGDVGSSNLVFALELTFAAGGDLQIELGTSDGGAVTGEDYLGISRTVVLPMGDTRLEVLVEVLGDERIELDESFSLALLSLSGPADLGDAEASGTIRNDDVPGITIESASSMEGDAGTRTLTFPVLLDGAPLEEVQLAFDTSDGSALAGVDFEAASGTLVVPAGQTSASLAVSVLGDGLQEPTETFSVELDLVAGPARLVHGLATGGILDDDGPRERPELQAQDAAVAEGDAGTTVLEFVVRLDRALPQELAFDYATVPGTARDPEDFTGVAGTATVPAGELSVAIPIDVHGDPDEEDSEFFQLHLSNMSADVAVLTPVVLGTVLDDDRPGSGEPARIGIEASSLLEGDAGSRLAQVQVSLTTAVADPVQVQFTTEDGTAMAPGDYTATSGTLTFAPGQRTRFIPVEVLGDTFTEDDEQFLVRLSNLTGPAVFDNRTAAVHILTDDPIARVEVSSAAVLEGDPGANSELRFEVRLDVATQAAVTLDYATTDETATEGDDYRSASGTLVIPAGDTVALLPVEVYGDAKLEDDERFLLTLSNPSPNAILQRATATGSILNDDGSAGWQGPRIVSANDGYAPSIVRGGPGDAMAIATWYANGEVLASVSSGSSWPAVPEVMRSGAYGVREPLGVTLDELGQGHVTWRDAGVFDRYFDGDWNPETDLTQVVPSWSLRVAGNPAGVVFAAWADLTDTSSQDLYWARFDPSTEVWSRAELLETNDEGSAYDPIVTVDRDGNALFVWRQSFSNIADYGLYWSRFDAGTGVLSDPQLVEAGSFPRNFDMAGNRDGEALLAVQEQGFAQQPDSLVTYFFDPQQQSFARSGPVEVEATYSAVLPRVVMAQDGQAFATWMQYDATGFLNPWASRYDPSSGTWDAAHLLEESDAGGIVLNGYPRVAEIEASGAAIVAWIQILDSVARVRASRFEPSTGVWSPAEQVDDETLGHAGEIQIASGIGGVFLIWRQPGAVLSNRFQE